MDWRSAVSENPSALEAAAECAAKAGGPGAPDLAFLFVSPHHAAAYERLPRLLREKLGPGALVGCSGGGVIGAGREMEGRPALSLLCGWLPGVRVHAFPLEPARMPGPDAPPKAWRAWLDLPAPPEGGALILLADPFSLDPEEMARGLDFAFPGTVKLGGLASGASHPRGNALFLDAGLRSEGGVGVLLDGNVAVDAVVAQGCRPIGEPMRVTGCERNHLLALDGRPVLEALQGLFDSLPEKDRLLARTSLFLGLRGDPLKAGTRDYLIRNLLGLDAERGRLAVGAMLRNGQTVQFHLRDGRSSARDLDERLTRYAKEPPATAPSASLLFSCMGRGEGLYGKPDHDVGLLRRRLGELPVGGFFCGGELGPVDGTTFLHGYTSCFGIIRPKE